MRLSSIKGTGKIKEYQANRSTRFVQMTSLIQSMQNTPQAQASSQQGHLTACPCLCGVQDHCGFNGQAWEPYCDLFLGAPWPQSSTGVTKHEKQSMNHFLYIMHMTHTHACTHRHTHIHMHTFRPLTKC